ncbi:MAG: tetratricopeptide repeat protein [Candidatus Electrothrix sp. GW3-4]|uniref:tetratricopeptide repeat protein n=1 Tax=Candidatus Electrothrix sp. GW3-4 TaxID=3126740 RepID=UPI0030D10D8B
MKLIYSIKFIAINAFFLIFTFLNTSYAATVQDFLRRGSRYMSNEHYAEALRIYEKGIQLYPNEAHLNLQAGFASWELGDYSEAKFFF